MKDRRSSSPSNAQPTIGGPALWLALACALGTGLMSREVGKYVGAYFDLQPLDVSKRGLSAVLMLGLGGLWFLLVWRILAWRCRSEPGYPRWRWLILLIYVSSSADLTITISGSLLQACFAFDEPLVLTFASYSLSSIGVGALLFAVRNPVDGFFCAGLSCLMLFRFFVVPGLNDIHPGYYATAAMGIAFAYLYGGFWSHLAVAGLGLVPIAYALLSILRGPSPMGISMAIQLGFLLLHGAIIGSVIWLIRKGIRRMRERVRAVPMQGSRN